MSKTFAEVLSRMRIGEEEHFERIGAGFRDQCISLTPTILTSDACKKRLRHCAGALRFVILLCRVSENGNQRALYYFPNAFDREPGVYVVLIGYCPTCRSMVSIWTFKSGRSRSTTAHTTSTSMPK